MNKDTVNPYKPLCAETRGILFPFAEGKVTEDEMLRFRAFQKSFGRMYCELGSGSGMHLIERASRDPSSLFVGFELRYKRVYRSYQKSEKLGLQNIAFLRTDAEALPAFFEAKSLEGIYVNFPDPWAKARWQKHRLLNAEFLGKICSLLCDSGFLSFKTDHREYFDQVAGIITGMPDFTINSYTNSLHDSEFLETNVSSEFEKLFKFKGLPVNYLLASKKSLKKESQILSSIL